MFVTTIYKPYNRFAGEVTRKQKNSRQICKQSPKHISFDMLEAFFENKFFKPMVIQELF